MQYLLSQSGKGDHLPTSPEEETEEAALEMEIDATVSTIVGVPKFEVPSQQSQDSPTTSPVRPHVEKPSQEPFPEPESNSPPISLSNSPPRNEPPTPSEKVSLY